MRRFNSITLGLVAVLLAFAFLPVVAPAQAAPLAAPAAQSDPNDSPCVADPSKNADPQIVLLGEEVNITLHVKAVCSGEQFPLHIVLVLDASGSMQDQGKGTAAKSSAKKLIDSLKLADNPLTMVGVVQFESSASTLCQLTNSASKAKGCVNRVGENGGTNILAGVQTGMRVLLQGRSQVQDREALREVMVVLSDGSDNAGCGGVIAAARQAKSQGVLVITVCVGADCDTQCMRQAASSPRYAFDTNDGAQLSDIFERIRQDIFNVVLKKMTVIDTLPDNMQYVPNSADPEPDRVGPNNEELEWTMNSIAQDGVTFTFKVKPLETGYHPTNLKATGEYLDNKSRKGEFEFSIPYVTVLQPYPLATPSSPPPTPTTPPTGMPTPPPPPTNTPTNTPTLPPTPTPTPTPTPKPRPIYLPIIVRETCENESVYADVVLVIDMSTSMNRNSVEGKPVKKLTAVLNAAKDFVNNMKFTPDAQGQHDQVAVVGFNDLAWIQHTLTNDKPAILQAIQDLPKKQQEGTRLDLAFQRGAEALPAALRMPGNTPTIILLTDGLPNRVPFAPGSSQEQTVIAAAQLVKDAGLRIYTIGVGSRNAPSLIDRVDPELLRACASSSSMFYLSPDASQLTNVYTEIAYTFGCRGQFFGGRR